MPVFPVTILNTSILTRHPVLNASSVEEEAGRLICLILRGIGDAKTLFS